MPVEVTRNEYAIVRASESIDLGNVDEFRMALEKAVAGSPKGLVIDLSDAVYIDSAGIQAIFGAYRTVHSSGGKIGIVAGNQNMRDLIGIVNLDMLPGVFLRDDLASAEQALGGQ